jgi:predicted RND superfamily exporter protein
MTPGSVSRQHAERYAAWLDNNRIAVLVVSFLIAVGGGYLASKMSVRSDLTNLLPASQRSVRDLTAIQKRARSFGTINVVVEADDPALCERAAKAVTERIATIDPSLVAQSSRDDGVRNRYAWDHRFLFAELHDLEEARDALRDRIQGARLAANPLYIDVDDDHPVPDHDRLADLERKLADLERKATHPPPRASPDGKLQLVLVQTTFPASDADRARILVGAIGDAIDNARLEVGPGARFGLTGNVTLSMYEHDSVLQGMTLSAVITVVLCAIALLLYYRSGRIVLAMLWALAVGVAATFAAAKLMVGHLNVMTAFLFAIVVGSGINTGLVFVARYLEEVRATDDPQSSLAVAIAGAMRGTLAATATATVAYTSLLITDFKGFRQFGAIAGAGMGLTWLATFTVLPAALFVFARSGWVKASRPPAIGTFLAALYPKRRLGTTVAVGAGVTAIALAISIVYVARDPFTHDWRDLQSSTASIRGTQDLDRKLYAAFTDKSGLSGQAYLLAVAVDRRDQVAPVVAYLRTLDTDRPPERRWIRDVHSIDELLPADQSKKLAVLHEIATLIDDLKARGGLDEADLAKLAKLRPPADLRAVVDADVPAELAWPFIERDGTRGRLILVRGASRFDSFNVDHRLEFAREARKLELPPGTIAAGEPLVVTDIIETMEHDAPNMILFALAGSILAVFVVIGLRRHGQVTLACGVAGLSIMIAACAVVGLHAHFLDLIALPITVGIGIDYAVNLVARDRQDGNRGPQHLLRTTGSTVLLCSYTTAVGYGTLLLSANGGIRAFGLAALLGEIACISIALVVAPAWLTLLRQRDVRRATMARRGGFEDCRDQPLESTDSKW